MTRAAKNLALLLIGGAVFAVEARARTASADFSWRDILLDGETGRTRLERCIQRCEKNYGATPSPGATATPVASPAPTRTPLPCTMLGKVERAFTLTAGEPIMFCFDVPADYPNALVEAKHRQTTNQSCSTLEAEFVGPDGARQYNVGNQIAGALPAKPGRFYWWVRLIEGCTAQSFYWK